MAILDNNPTLRYVSVKNMIIEFNKEKYPIANFYSNKKYFYWDASQPYQLIETNERKKEIGNRYLVIINDKGVHTLMPNDEYSVTFDGDNPDLIINSITSIYESIDGIGDKFTNVENDIEGIRQTVGSSTEDDGSILQKISILEQRDDSLNLSVSKLEKDFSDNKEVVELRENLNKSMIDFNAGLGIFKQDINTYFKDNKIDSEEKLKINTHLDMTDNKRSEVIKYVDIVINIMQSEGQTSQVNRLNSVKTKFLNSVKNLRTYITTATSDNTIVPSEITGTIDLFAKCNVAINELKNTCDDCIFLGAGGKITEELARIGIKSDEILISVSKNENTIRNNLSIEKNLLQGDMDDFDDALEVVKNAIKDLTKDGSINDTGKEIISEKISLLDIEKSHIDNKYDELYNNANISDGVKKTLKTEYDLFNNKYEETKLVINENLLDGFVNEAELAQIDTVINELYSSKINLHPKMTQSMDDIQDNINKAELKAAKDELQGNINDVDGKVGDLNDYVNGTFENNILDETERKTIKSNLDNLQREKVDIDNQYNQLNGNKFLDGILKTNYTTSYNNFLSKYNSLIDLMNGILNKPELINNSDRDNMNNGYIQLNETIGTFVRISNEVIEYIVKKEAEYVKDVLNQDITDVDNKINDLNDSINNTFKNNVIDESERKAISLNLKDLESQKIDIDNQYNQLILSTFLDGTLKVEFENKYNDLASKYNSLVKVMNDILSKEELINDTDRNNMNSARDLFNLSIGEFSRVVNRVIEYIGKKQSESAVGDFSKQLEDLNDKVDGILDDVGGALADDIIDETERIAIKQSLKELEKEFISNEVEYQKIYSNVNLVGDIKTQLNTAYNTYTSKYNNLIDTINFLLNKVGLIDDLDRKNLDNAYMEYGTAIRLYLSKLYEAIDSITNKGISDAKNEMNKELEDLSSSLSVLEETMNGVFKDGILSDAEKLAIKQNIKTLEIEKADIDKSYSTVYNNKNLIGTPKSDLKNSYDLYVLEYNNLIKTIDDILSKTGLVDNTDKTKLDTAFSKHKISLSDFKAKYNIAIDSITNKGISDAKELLQNEINDLNNALGDLESTMNNAFKDGILSDAEKLAIKQNLQTISNEKVDVDKQYNSVYENPDLIGNAKINLKTSYDAYVIKYNALVVIVNDILNKVGLVDSTDQSKLDNGFNEYRLSSGEYSKRVNEAIDSIAKKKADDAEKNANAHTNAQIKVVNDAITSKVSQEVYDNNNKVIEGKFSEVNQTVDSITSSITEIGDVVKATPKNWVMNSNFTKVNGEILEWGLWNPNGGELIKTYSQFPKGEGAGLYIAKQNTTCEYHGNKFKVVKGTKLSISADVVREENVAGAAIILRELNAKGEAINDTRLSIGENYRGRVSFKVEITRDDAVEARVIFQNTGAKIDTTYYAIFYFNRIQVELGDKVSPWTLSHLDNATNRFSKIDQRIDGIDIEVGGKVGERDVIAAINMSPESIRIHGKKIDIQGTTTMGNSPSGRYVEIENEDYSVYNGNIRCLHFGYMNWQGREGLPEFLMGANGMNYNATADDRSGNYFGMASFTREKNPNGWDLDYQCIYYKRAGNDREIKVEMAEDGRLRLLTEHSLALIDKGYGYLTINHGNGGLMMENGFTAGKYDRCTFLKDIVVEGGMCHNDLQQGVCVRKYWGSEYTFRPTTTHAMDLGTSDNTWRNLHYHGQLIYHGLRSDTPTMLCRTLEDKSKISQSTLVYEDYFNYIKDTNLIEHSRNGDTIITVDYYDVSDTNIRDKYMKTDDAMDQTALLGVHQVALKEACLKIEELKKNLDGANSRIQKLEDNLGVLINEIQALKALNE